MARGPTLEAVSENQQIYKTLDLALRVGEILLSSGAGAADVTATMLAVADHLGLRSSDVEVDVTFTSLRMGYQVTFEDPPLISMRTVRYRDIDYEDVTIVDHIVGDLLRGEIDREAARARVARVYGAEHRTPRWAVSVAWGVTGAGVAAIVGADWVVGSIAFVAAVGIDLLKGALSRRRIPFFFQQALGGMLATLFALGSTALGLSDDPSLVITASIVLLLSGIGFMGALQDALTGFPLTAGARLLEAVLATAGIIAGVSGGLSLAPLLGVELADIEPGAALQLSDLTVMGVGAAVTAAAFAFACYAPKRSLPAVALIAGFGGSIGFSLSQTATSAAWASGVAAAVIGVVSYWAASKVSVPPLVVVVPAVVPMLPGLAIYRGLTYLGAADTYGLISLASAAGTTIALAAGVILGEYVAQPLRRETKHLEDRLSGPRLVGPYRAIAPRALELRAPSARAATARAAAASSRVIGAPREAVRRHTPARSPRSGRGRPAGGPRGQASTPSRDDPVRPGS